MMQSGLTGTVRERLEPRHAQSVHAPDVDHPARVEGLGASGAGFFEQRGEQLRDGEDAVQVEG